jgi:hypothetical protein
METKWKTYLQLIGVGLSILALYVSWRAYDNSVLARKDARAISGLDLKPKISLNTLFKEINKIPPHYVISNNGPVDALQIEVQLISHRYRKDISKIKVSTTGSDERKIIPKLPPLTNIAFKFPELWLDVNARIEQPPEHNIMEIRISYRRPPDMMKYTESAFYFINKEGRWVAENDNSLDKDIYAPIKNAMFENIKQGDMLIKNMLRTDILHNID